MSAEWHAALWPSADGFSPPCPGSEAGGRHQTLVKVGEHDMQIRKAPAIQAQRFGIDGLAGEEPLLPFAAHVRDTI